MDELQELLNLIIKHKLQHDEHKEHGEMNEFGDSMEDQINRMHYLATQIMREEVKQDVAA